MLLNLFTVEHEVEAYHAGTHLFSDPIDVCLVLVFLSQLDFEFFYFFNKLITFLFPFCSLIFQELSRCFQLFISSIDLIGSVLRESKRYDIGSGLMK